MTNEELDRMLLLFEIVQVLFVFAFGACIGSLTNVLVYRLPLGLDVVTPTSRCPSCGTKLTWRENIPIFGWLMLRGKCRFCRSPISAEYPIVETFVALLFVLIYLILYADQGRFLGIHFGVIRPSWALNGLRITWPTFIVWLILFSCLTSATIIDARTYHIPMVLTWVPAGVGIVFHILHAIWVQMQVAKLTVAHGWYWTIPTPSPTDWPWIGGAIGGMVGLLLSNVLVAKGIFRRSFADYEEWEKQAIAQQGEGTGEQAEGAAGEKEGQATKDAPITDLWIRYPHARREMLRELIFLAPCIGLGLAGAGLAVKLAGPWGVDPSTGAAVPAVHAPLWLMVMGGTFLGFLVGGGFLWGIRIVFSLLLGKEALGLGDIHLMAAVGACLGWIDTTLAFFGAALVGLVWAILGAVLGGKVKRAMPFGPYLAIATLLVVLTRPWIESGLSRLMPAFAPIHLP